MIVSSYLLFWIVASLASSISIVFFIGLSESWVFNFLQFAIIYVSLFFAGKNPRRPISLMTTNFIFFLFFFGIIPLNDIVVRNVYWGGSEISIHSAELTSFFILLALLLFCVLYVILDVKNKYIQARQPHIIKLNYTIFYPLFFLSCFYIFYKSNFNIFQGMFRGLSDVDLMSKNIVIQESNKTVALIYNNIIKPMPIVMFIVALYLYKQNAISITKTSLLILFAFVLIFNSPFSMPRYQSGSLYLSIVLIMYNRVLLKPLRFLSLFLFGILIIFPFLDKFRSFNTKTFNFYIDFNYLKAGHFDAFNNFVLVVDNSIITLGKQVFTVFLFFIPRALWPEKSVGSGHFVAAELNLAFSNISMPYLAEGYINFGILGMFIFVIIYSLGCIKLDNAFYGGKLFSFVPLYYILIGMCFFVMRGDLLSSYAYTFASITLYILVYKMCVYSRLDNRRVSKI